MNCTQLDNLCKIHKKRTAFLSTALLEFFLNILYNFYDSYARPWPQGRVGREIFFADPTHMGVKEKRREKI